MKKNLKLIAVLAGLILLAVVAIPVGANGAPVRIFLNYLPEFSNYGPNTAAGEVQVSIGEAWVDLSADGLPPLTGETYEGWLVELNTDRYITVGKFNADANNHIGYYVELNQLPVTDYRYFVITVEQDPDPSPDPDPRITLAGLFPDPKLEIVSVTATPTLPLVQPGQTTAGITGTTGASTTENGAATTPTPPPPATLPVTGSARPGGWGLGLGLGIILSGLLLARRLKRKGFSKSSTT